MQYSGGFQAFRIRKGVYSPVDVSSTGDYGSRMGGEGFIYSVMRLNNGFIFSQNAKITGKKSYLFLNTDKFSLKEMSGRLP